MLYMRPEKGVSPQILEKSEWENMPDEIAVESANNQTSIFWFILDRRRDSV